MTTSSPSVKTIILTAPPGWGKTRNAEALGTELGCTYVLDDWDPRTGTLYENTLHLTNVPPEQIAQRGRDITLVARGWS